MNNQAIVTFLNACHMLLDNIVSSDLDRAAYSIKLKVSDTLCSSSAKHFIQNVLYTQRN